MILALLVGLALAVEPVEAVDLTVHLPEGRTLMWTHLVEVNDASHWGESAARAVVLTQQTVARGGAIGKSELEWTWRTDRAAVQMMVGGKKVADWDDRRAVPPNAPEITRFALLAGTGYRVLASATGKLQSFRLVGDGLRGTLRKVWGPSTAELLNWFSGLTLGGRDAQGQVAPLGSLTPGEVVTRTVLLPVHDVGTARCDLAIRAEEPGRKDVSFRYDATCTPLPTSDQPDAPRLLELSGKGNGVVDLRRHRVTEHTFESKAVFKDGLRRVTREERTTSFLDKVRRRPPR